MNKILKAGFGVLLFGILLRAFSLHQRSQLYCFNEGLCKNSRDWEMVIAVGTLTATLGLIILIVGIAKAVFGSKRKK